MSGADEQPATARDDAASVQATVAAVRGRLLGGRGPGADADEIARHTHDRRRIGGIPTPDLLDRTAREAAAARSGRAAGARWHPAWLAAALAVALVIGYRIRSRRSARRTAGPPASPPGRGRSR